jgi:hypothetical protein
LTKHSTSVFLIALSSASALQTLQTTG